MIKHAKTVKIHPKLNSYLPNTPSINLIIKVVVHKALVANFSD